MRRRTCAVPVPFLLFPCLALATACGRSDSPAPSSAAPAASIAPVTPASGARLYISDETGGNVVVVDPGTGQVVERIAVGKRPRGIRISRDGTQLLVALSGSPIAGPGVDESKLPPPDRTADGIGVVDLATHKLLRTLPSGQDPEVFDLSPDGKTIYVSNEDAAQMSVVDLSSGAIRDRVKVGEEPEGVTVTPDGREVYITCEGNNEVTAIDTATYKVLARMTTGPRPRSVTFTTDGATAFVTSENGAAVTVIDAAARKVVSTIQIPKSDAMPTAARPMGGVLSPDGRQVFVSLGRAGGIAILDTAGRTLVRVIEKVGQRPWGIGVSADGRKLYTANGASGDVSVVDIATGTVDKRIVTGGSPWGVAVR